MDTDKFSKHGFFSTVAKRIADCTGNPIAFGMAALIVAVWAITGPLFQYSDTWQLVINTGTTIVTFLMVFLIQNAQNRDTRALQLKLDELIRVTEGAHTALLDLEELDDTQLGKIQKSYEKIASQSRREMKNHADDTHVPHIELPGMGEKPAPKRYSRRPKRTVKK